MSENETQYYRYWIVERKKTFMIVPLTAIEIEKAGNDIRAAVAQKGNDNEKLYTYHNDNNIEAWDAEGPMSKEEADEWKEGPYYDD